MPMRKLFATTLIIFSGQLHAACTSNTPEKTEQADPNIMHVIFGSMPEGYDSGAASVLVKVPLIYNGAEVTNIQIIKSVEKGKFIYQLPLNFSRELDGNAKVQFSMAYSELAAVEVSIEYACKNSEYMRYQLIKKLEPNKSLKDAP